MNKLYIHTEAIHNLSAPRVIVPIVLEMVKPKSVLDVGCGTGTWLRIFQEYGIKDFLGIDGDYVDRSLLLISGDKFLPKDLRKNWSLNRKFDLVVSLEVAEHLPDDVADIFVSTLAAHGDTVLFSAAIPGQGGQNHVNEQWPQYWQKKFEQHGLFFYDLIRPIIWNDDRIEWWYKQNIFLLKRQIPFAGENSSMALVHPELFELKEKQRIESYHNLEQGRQGLLASLSILGKAFIHKIRQYLRND